MEMILGFLKGVFRFVFILFLLSFVIGYMIGNHYATKAMLNYPGYVSFGNLSGWMTLSIAKNEKVSSLVKIDYDNLPE